MPMAASTKIVAAVVIPTTPPDPRRMAPAPRKPMPWTILEAIRVPLESPKRCASSLERMVNSAVARHTNRSEEHTSELQSPCNLVCRLLLEKKNHAHRPIYYEKQKHPKYQTN